MSRKSTHVRVSPEVKERLDDIRDELADDDDEKKKYGDVLAALLGFWDRYH